MNAHWLSAMKPLNNFKEKSGKSMHLITQITALPLFIYASVEIMTGIVIGLRLVSLYK